MSKVVVGIVIIFLIIPVLIVLSTGIIYQNASPDILEVYQTKKNINLSHPFMKGTNFSHKNNFLEYIDLDQRITNNGNNLFAKRGIPIVNIETGKIVKKGWNDAGGWSIGIESLDKKRYFFYAHMERFAEGLNKGQMVKNGEVIGFTGDTGYGPEGTEGKISPGVFIGLKVDNNGDWRWVDPYNLLMYLETANVP